MEIRELADDCSIRKNYLCTLYNSCTKQQRDEYKTHFLIDIDTSIPAINSTISRMNIFQVEVSIDWLKSHICLQQTIQNIKTELSI